ncbi:hypothetical protein EK21DRAFT_105476 [Setomelanomma holmii]|uniref:DUF1996 domain-containing protein n=1 Tax=Setomelanomma holmii TaxID=210430 RepID=A0A9P4LEC6_9PLEO|nr:hypothetical protein EK21DRAFT_105476 [Setomelanomma holmii]
MGPWQPRLAFTTWKPVHLYKKPGLFHDEDSVGLRLSVTCACECWLCFPCAQLVIDRLDPLATPGQAPSPHLHQILGADLPGESTCTSCLFSEDFSNDWTAVLYFKARNSTYKRVPQLPNVGFDGVNGGMTQTSKVQAFQPRIRMFIGDVNARTKQEAERFLQLTFTCLQNMNTRDPQTLDFPKAPCSAGIMTANIDSPDHMAHMSYPEFGSFESGGPCPVSHPVRMGQLFYEGIWDTKQFNNKADWPTDGSQPFVWSFGDGTGNANHGDYLFGWQGDAPQRALDSPCYQNCPTLKTQDVAAMNKCTVPRVVNQDIDGCQGTSWWSSGAVCLEALD